MEIRNLVTFVQVAELNSFTKAAVALGYTQSTVSDQIRQLEEELDCRLFDRINHSIKLTDRGRRLLEYAQGVEQLTAELHDDFSGEEQVRGHVRIVTSDSICEAMMFRNYHDFSARYPEISLEFATANTDDMLSILDRNEADVIFTLDAHLYRSEYVIVKEEPVALNFVVGAGSPLAGRNDITMEELSRQPFLLTEKGTSYRKILDNEMARRSLEVKAVLEMERTDIIAYCLESGKGVSFLPDFVTGRKMRAGSLVYLPVRDFQVNIWKQLIYHKKKWLSKSLTAFIEYVKDHEFGTWFD